MTSSAAPQQTNEDLQHMRAALALARRGLGQVWPNPAVGCILVQDQMVVGRGWTRAGGRPHAETEALRRAATASRGATAYVSLEPCNHHGETPPCTEALIAAGIARVVVATEDPDPRVSGRGVARLQAAGIPVVTGVCRSEAEHVNAGFFMRCRRNRPMITLKLATSLDGRIATATGDSQWITGEDARAHAHRLRAEHDAILIGSGTALVDDPALSCRLAGMQHRSPVRIVADGRLRMSLTARLVTTAREIPTWIFTLADTRGPHRDSLIRSGVTVIESEGDGQGHPAPTSVAAALGERGLTRVMLEGGGRLAASFLRAGLIDRLCLFSGARVIGGDGVSAVASLGVESLKDAPRFIRTAIQAVAGDLWASFAIES